MSFVFSLLVWLSCALLWLIKILFLGSFWVARWIAYLSWPLWATIVGLGALVGLM